MAIRKMKYVFTPARRQALRKARSVSAANRHRNAKAHPKKNNRIKSFGKGALYVGGAIAATAAAYHTERYIVHPSEFGRDAKAFGRFAGNTIKGIMGASKGVSSLTPHNLNRGLRVKPMRRNLKIRKMAGR